MVGTSHQGNNTVCQDCCWADVVEAKSNKKHLVAIVSDGAGSALKGAEGSELSCETLLQAITKTIEQHGKIGDEADVIGWINNVRQALFSQAERNQLTARDYACTLLCAVVTDDTALFFQIGDGAMVVAKDNIFGVVFWPDSGEYANSTYFITDDAAMNHLRISKTSTTIKALALFSDGLQHLALSYVTKTPHPPFFEPMFKMMRQRKTSDCDDLDEQLARFLNSDAINTRTDDDKTLVLVIR